jgi:hypothetical protein
MNTEKFEGQYEGWRTLWLAIAGGYGRYVDVECAYAELQRYLVLNCNE